MSNRVVVYSDTDKHVLFSLYKAYYPYDVGQQKFFNHKHSELEVTCVLGGSGTYTCCGDDYSFSKGDVFLHCVNDIHYFSNINSGDIPVMLAIKFDPRFIWSPSGEWSYGNYIRLFSHTSTVERRIPHDTQTAGIIEQLLEEMFNESQEHKPAYDLLIKAKLMTILANLVRHFESYIEENTKPITTQKHLSQMETSINYILGHLGENLSLEKLASEACMSRSYYSTIFKELNGVSVWEYIIHQRVNLAQYQLETTNEKVINICEDCGFVSIANFNRAFKRITGKTPRDYRESHGK